MSRVLLQVDDEHGTATVLLDHQLTDQERTVLGGLLPELGENERWLLLALLTRELADEQAYDRVREQRGLLW